MSYAQVEDYDRLLGIKHDNAREAQSKLLSRYMAKVPQLGQTGLTRADLQNLFYSDFSDHDRHDLAMMIISSESSEEIKQIVSLIKAIKEKFKFAKMGDGYKGELMSDIRGLWAHAKNMPGIDEAVLKKVEALKDEIWEEYVALLEAKLQSKEGIEFGDLELFIGDGGLGSFDALTVKQLLRAEELMSGIMDSDYFKENIEDYATGANAILKEIEKAKAALVQGEAKKEAMDAIRSQYSSLIPENTADQIAVDLVTEQLVQDLQKDSGSADYRKALAFFVKPETATYIGIIRGQQGFENSYISFMSGLSDIILEVAKSTKVDVEFKASVALKEKLKQFDFVKELHK